MKKYIFILFIACIAQFGFTQAPPQGVNYQAVVYSDNGNNQPGLNVPGQVLRDKNIRVRFSILQNQSNGTEVYKESHTKITDAFGMFSLVIGEGTQESLNAFSVINWAAGKHYLKVEIDKNGGTNYVTMSNQQLLSVPYALYSDKSTYATTAGNGIASVSDNGNGSLTFTYTDGSTYTTPILTGLQGPQGATGAQGPAGQNGANGTNGVNGTDGINGTNGVNGQNGLSAYEIWLAQGNLGTEQDFLTAITGAQGIPGSQNAWSLNGNAGTSTATNFIGTTDSQDWLVKTNNQERIRVTSSGNVGIGTIPDSNVNLQINTQNGSKFKFYGNSLNYPSMLLNDASDSVRFITLLTNTNTVPTAQLGFSGTQGSNRAINFKVNNSDILHLVGNGNIGIGTTFPLGKLHVNNDVIGADSSFVVRTDGKVGVGTSSPNFKFQINGPIANQASGSNQILRYFLDNNSQNRFQEKLNYVGDSTQIDIDPIPLSNNGSADIRFFRHTNTTSYKAVSFFRGNGTTQGSARIGIDGVSSFFQLQGGNFGIGTASPLGKFHVNNNVIGSDSSFVVTTDGKVGIGTTSPTDKVVIEQGGMRINGKFGIGFNDDPYSNNLSTGWEGAKIYWEEGTINTSLPNSDYLVLEKKDGNGLIPDGGIAFANRGNNGARSISMVISGLGNVGIGTIAPARSLHVNAVMRLEPIPTAPTSPSKGDMYFDSTINKLRVFDGTVWQNCW